MPVSLEIRGMHILSVCYVETSVPVISQSFQSVKMECGLLLRLVSVMNPVLILFCSCSAQGREPYLCNFIFENLTLVCVQTFKDQFVSNLV